VHIRETLAHEVEGASMKTRLLESIAAFVLESLPKVQYGQIVITITRHGGRTTLIEKTASVKEQPDEARHE
jgi:hypothetical protein